MPHCYSSVYLVLLVVVLLFGASKLASCSYEKNELQADPQLIIGTKHEKRLVAATRYADDGWITCGKLDLSSKYKIYTAAGVRNVLQHYTKSMDVALSPETGIVRCRCHRHLVSPPTVDTTNHQVAIKVHVVDSKDNHFKISLPLEPVPCQVAYCRRNPTALLTIQQQQSISERVSLRLNSECTTMLLNEHSSPLNVQLLGNGAVTLSALPTSNLRRKNSSLPRAYREGPTSVNSGISLRNQHQLGQKCSIDVIYSIKLANGIDSPNTHDINLTQLLPLELINCINLLNDHHATVGPSEVLLSIKPWLSSHDTIFAGLNSQGSYHAELSTTSGAVNTIHEKGGHVVSKSATKHGTGVSKIREVRQISSSPPEFNDTFYMASVFENSPHGTVVTTVRATGNGPITYTMTPDNSFSNGLFRMNSSTGVVTTTGSIDREIRATHTFRIQATDSGRSSIAQMTITVKDENDNTPTFERSYFNLTVEEDKERDYTIHRFTVTDPDASLNGMIEYTLINDTDNTFTVTEAGSQIALKLNRPLNFEAQRFYLLTITARDRGSPPRSSSATFEIHIIDVADSLPQFNATSYSTEVAENAPPSTYLVTVHATSQDSAPLATIQYIKVSGDSNNQFSVDGNTGVITLTKSLDFETLQLHVLKVQAQSVANPSLQSQTNVHIRVTNINDHSPVFTRSAYSISVLETVAIRHLVITVDAPDLDDGVFGQVSYHFDASTEQAINDTFMLDPMSGQVTTIRRLDREQREQYSFTVVATDGGTPPRSSTGRVSITVSDVNDEPPIFSQQQYVANISENLDVGRSVTQVLAQDRDSAVSMIIYTIESGHNNAFGIDSQDGLITTRVRLDREVQASYNLIVVASDGNNENTTRVLITVLDVNDETPTFDLSLYNPDPISEGLSVGSEVLRVQATDLDDDSNGEVTYTSTNIDQRFRLNSATGVILLSLSLDYEENTRYVFDVTATDGGRPPRSSTARVQIAVFDINDNSPVFEPHLSTFSIRENQQAGIIVTTLTATDADSGSNAIVQYEITGDSQAIRAFGIRQNGVIDTRESLDREIISQYEIVVRASDSGTVRRTETTRLTVNVEDEIDYPPVFSQVVYEVSIMSLLSRGLPVVTVQATTRDMVLPQSIIYRITSGANNTLFRMDQTTGMIFAVTNIDPVLHEGVYRLGIEARHQHLSESVFVIIRVKLDDGIPRIRPLTLYFSAYPTLIGTVNHLGVVEIDQPKEGQEYTFSLLYSNPRVQRHFLINPTTGALSVAHGVLSGRYQLNISATTSTGTGFGSVEVFISILTNHTLENAVVATFGGAREASFASIQLDQFIQFLMETIPCSRSQVEVISIQRSGLERDEMVSLAFAILEPSLTSTYIARDKIIDTLLANSHNAQPSTLLSFISDVCSEDSCQNLQRCRPIIEIHRDSHASLFRVISGTYHFHAFRESHICSCPEGYSRDDLCSSEINECNPSPCYFGAKCTDYVGDYQCECPIGTYGKNCSSICASQDSCDPCDPNPCLYEGTCSRSLHNLASYSCSDCPWDNGYNGPNCELTTLHFTSGRSSFVAFQTSADTARLDLVFRFATISPNGLLFYSGNLGNKNDHIAAELVIGQLRVGVSFGGTATTLITDSIWNLNDGQWHSVSIKLRSRVLKVEVSDCSGQSQFLQGAIETCRLEATLPSESGRTLELNSLLYFGGLEPHVTHNSVLSTIYDGCIANVKLGGRLLDFGQPTREQGTSIGCPPLEGSCSQLCPRNEECVKLWSGSVCNCDGDNCVGGSSAQLSNGYIHLETSTINLMSFIISFRTRSSDATLVQLGAFDSLELKHGSVVYRRSYSSTNMYTPLTLEAFGAVSDGVWHRVRLDINSTHTKLSVDEGRSAASSPEGGAMMITMVTLGAEVPESNSSRFSGCLARVVINSESINLHSALANTLTEYRVSTHMAESGCGRGSPCTNIQCSDNTQCQPGWQNYSCVCSLPNQIVNNECINPCSTNPCKNGGTCETSAHTLAGYQCTCAQRYEPPNCEDVVASECGLGFFNPPTCTERCLCDPRGADPQKVCNTNGDCSCKAELNVYNVSGDLGCQLCDCHALGSMSSKCNEATGQCACQENVVGRRCDTCAANFAGMDKLGCKAAAVVYGSFSFLNLFYKRELGNTDSTGFKELSQLISIEVERELYSFTLPGRFEATIEEFSNSSGYVMISYRISNYLPQGSTHLPLPPYSILAGVVQSMVQSGWVGPFQTNSSSHMVPTDCSLVPKLCSGCPNVTTSDGLICRTAATCLGEDTDRDGIPDSCDSCPYNFNPDQNHTYCEPISGVCPGGVASGILWSQTSVDVVDIKPCPAPLLGFASRTCLASQKWSEVDVLGCLSVAGQEYLAQAESLDGGQSLSFIQLEQTAAQLEDFTNEQGQTSAELYGGDVQVAGRVLDHLLRQLQGYATSEAAGRDEIVQLYEDLISTSNNLLSPNPSRGWVSVVREAEFGPEAFLTTLEQLPVTALNIMWENSLDSSPWEHILINTRRPSATNRNETRISTTLSLSELSTFLELSIATPTSSVAMAMFANLGQGLNSYLFNSSTAEPLSVGTPILSVQVFNEAASKITTLSAPINLTLPYRGKLYRPQLRSKAVCAWWQSGERSGWSTEGCERVSVSLSHVTCRCSHLTAFAAILPAAAFQEIIIPPERFTPHPFTYLIFIVVTLLLLATLVLLTVPRHLQNLLNTTHKNLILALLLTSVVFVVGINRTEAPGVCGAFSVVLFYLLLSCLSWMVASGIIVVRFLFKTLPKEKFAITLYIIGWALPALLTGIAIGVVALIGPSNSFLSKFGYPYYCWISVQNFGGFVAPALLLILVYIAIVLLSIALQVRLRRKKEGGRALSPAATLIRNNTSMILLKSSSIFLLFLVSWGLGLVAVYLRDETYGDGLQYPFAILYGAFGLVVFTVLCINKNLKEAWKLQFKKQPDVIIGQTTGPVYAEIRRPPVNQRRSSRQQPQQQQQHRHHHHHHRHRHGFHNPNHRSSTAQPEQPRGEMVELMTIAQPPPHPPPSPMAINSGANLGSHSHSSPLLNSVDVTRGSTGRQNQNRSTSERHILSENQVQPSILHVPEMRPFSPLTYGSDSGSNISNFDDIDHVPLPPMRMQGIKEEIRGATAATVVSTIAEDSIGEKEDLSKSSENIVSHEREVRLTSPTLTEIYERARRSSQGTSASAGSRQDSVLGAAANGTQPNPLIPEESNGLTAVASEDPLWYQNSRESGNNVIESDPMPYETAVRSPPPISPGPVSPSMAAGEGEMRPSPFFPMISSTASPFHSSDGSATSSSKHSSNKSRSSYRHHTRSPASASPAGLGSPIQQHQRKHSLPVENTKKRSGGSSTKNPLYSTSAVVSTKKHLLKKHHRSFNSPKDGQPLPPLPPGVPIHASPLPPLPHPLENPGSTSPMSKRAVVRTGSDATRHTHFAPHISFPHQTNRQPSPRIPTGISSRQTPPLAQVSTPPPPKPYQVSGTKETSPSLQLQVGVGEERRSLSCSSSPARSRQKKKRGLERNDSYHSEGPSAEGKKVNQVIKHSDGSETVQSLV